MGKSAFVAYKFEKTTISVVGGLSDSKDGLKQFSTVLEIYCFLLANSQISASPLLSEFNNVSETTHGP